MRTRPLQQEPIPRQSPEEVYADLGFSRPPNVDGVLASYIRLPRNEITSLHQLHYTAVNHVLWGALSTYNNELIDVLSAPRVNRHQLGLAEQDLNYAVKSARNIDFPTEVLTLLSFDFIDFSLNHDRQLLPAVRKAAATMGIAVGNDSLRDRQVAHIIERLNESIKKDGKIPDETEDTGAQSAKRLLDDLGVSVHFKQTPSAIEVVKTYTVQHARSIAFKAAVAAVAASVFTPTIAKASEPTPPIIQISPSDEVGLGAQVSPMVIHTDEAPAIAPIIAPPSSDEVTPPMSRGVGVSIDTSPQPVPKAPIIAPVVTDVAPPMGKTPDVVVPVVPISSDTAEPVAPVVAPIAEVAPDPSAPDPSTLTPEQKSAQLIANSLNNDGEISHASAQILKYFGYSEHKTTTDDNGNEVPVVTNALLLENITSIGQSYKDLITASGHADVKYINTSLMAIAVLEAAAQDKTILDSKEVQGLVANAAAPTDPYQLRLFNEYLATAKTTLETNNSGALIAGFNGTDDPNAASHTTMLETLYAYVLMADTTDVDQASKIQVMKDADAEAAAKAAAEAAAKAKAEQEAQEKANGTQSPSAEAVATLIGSETDPVKKAMLIAFQFFMDNGYTADQAAGIVGNLHRESGSTMNPSTHQKGGPAIGLAQWEGGRAVTLKAFAASIGKPWDDFHTQLLFIFQELNTTHRTANKNVLSSTNIHDATDAFLKYYEVPYIINHSSPQVIEAETNLRASRAQGMLDSYNAQLKTVIDARAAAAAKAEAERNNHMSVGQDILNNLANTLKNGDLPDSALTVIDDPHINFAKGIDNLNSDYYDQMRHFKTASLQLNPEAARQLEKLADAYATQFNTTFSIAAAYRSVPVQQDQKKFWTGVGKPGNAAAPGHSNHGWGLAIDIQIAGGSKGAEEHRWLVEHAPTYGWVWPKVSGELWHFEYMGSAAQGNSNDAPEPGLKQR